MSDFSTQRDAVFSGSKKEDHFDSFDWAQDVEEDFGPIHTVGEYTKRKPSDILKMVKKQLNYGMKITKPFVELKGDLKLLVNICDTNTSEEITVKTYLEEDDTKEDYIGVGKTRVVLDNIKLIGESFEDHYHFLKKVKDNVTDPKSREIEWAMEVVEKSKKLKNPTMRLCKQQLPTSYVVPRDKREQEKILQDFTTTSMEVLFENHESKVNSKLRERLDDLTRLGKYTRHNPEELRHRVLRYCNERLVSYEGAIQDCINLGKETLRMVKNSSCHLVQARTISGLTEEDLYNIMNNGSPGEYKYFGVKSRKSPELLRTTFLLIKSYLQAARATLENGDYPMKQLAPEVLTLLFGKREVVSDSIEKGELKSKVQRCIFDCSPVPYALASFLFDDLATQFKKYDPTFGPGFGKARGNDWKIIDFLNHSFSKSVISEAKMIMADVKGWDTTLKEAIIEILMDLWDSMIDKSNLDQAETLARKWLVELSLEYIQRKIIAHPSGFVFELYGCMPSGSWFTSNFNTDANTIFFYAMCYYISGRRRVYQDLDVLNNCVRSNGDNQLASDELITRMGGVYNLEKHKSFFKELGLELKPSETMVSNQLQHVAYCSTKYYRVENGDCPCVFIPIRPWSLILPKLYGKELDDMLTAKFYVRQIMIDTMGTDPLIFEYLSYIDSKLGSIDLGQLKGSKKKILKSLKDVCVKLTGEEVESEDILEMLSDSDFSREACISLISKRYDNLKTGYKYKYKLGTEFMLGHDLGSDNRHFAEKDPRFRIVNKFTKENFYKFLEESNQLDVLLDKDDYSHL